jgi:hypothetical protein
MEEQCKPSTGAPSASPIIPPSKHPTDLQLDEGKPKFINEKQEKKREEKKKQENKPINKRQLAFFQILENRRSRS